MKIFYSWQSDTPAKIGKAFVRSALDSALKEINASMDLNEAERPSIDQDTQGIMGSPGIADTIFEKIRNSDVVVADVTLVGAVNEDKKLINSNVGIELGFALGHHGDHIILAVMNTYYGSPDNLPFDLKHRRWPVRFELAPDSDKETREKIQKELSKEFVIILREYIKRRITKPNPAYLRISSTDNPAMYWNKGEYLVDDNLSGDNYTPPLQLAYTKDQPLIYLRMWPDAPLEELTGKELKGLQSKGILPLLERNSEGWCDRNKNGIISYSGRNAGYLIATTQVFKNREIWGIEAFLLKPKGSEYNFNFVPTGAVRKGIIDSLKSYLKLANHLGYPKTISIEFGMVNVTGFKLALPRDYWDQFSDPILEDIFLKTAVNQEDPASFDLAISKIFDKIYDAVGMHTPET